MNPVQRLMVWMARRTVKASTFTIIPSWVRESFLTPSFRTLTDEGYKRNAAFFNCVSTLAMSFPEPPLTVYDGDGDEAERLPTHPLRFLLRRPNPLMGEDELAIYTIVYLAIGGNAYWHKVRARTGAVIQLWPYHAGQILPVPGGDSWIAGYEYDDGTGRKVKIPSEDIVHFKWPAPDPAQPWMAQPPLLAAAREVDTDNEATRYLFALLKNDAVPRVMIMTPADVMMDFEQKRQLKEQFVRTYGGDGRGEPAVLDGGAKVERLSLGLQELAFEALHRIPEARIAGALRVPPIIAGLNVGLERSTFANYAEAVKHFTTGTLVPFWRLVASEVEADLGPEFGGGVSVRHDLSQVQALQEDQNAKWQRVNGAINAGYITVNEARRRIGEKTIPGGDVFLWRSTTTPQDQGSVGAVVAVRTEQLLNPPTATPVTASATNEIDLEPAKALAHEIRAARREVRAARKALETPREG